MCVLFGLALPAIGSAAGPYVSLGDSYTSAPLVPVPTGNPIGCGRSTNNYPSDVARVIKPSSFTDVSCGSATTVKHDTAAVGSVRRNQPSPVQRAGDRRRVGHGRDRRQRRGADRSVEQCVELDIVRPFGSACKNHYAAAGGDPNVAAIKATGPKVAAVLQGIHSRAPQAHVVIVGYPDGLPVNGSNCWPTVPLSSGDISYINSLEQQLNSAIAAAASGNNATYVDTFASSVGHDACKAPGVAWVNGVVPTSPGYPLHPNQAGEQNMAEQVLAALGAG
jgi:hypothetical protein